MPCSSSHIWKCPEQTSLLLVKANFLLSKGNVSFIHTLPLLDLLNMSLFEYPILLLSKYYIYPFSEGVFSSFLKTVFQTQMLILNSNISFGLKSSLNCWFFSLVKWPYIGLSEIRQSQCVQLWSSKFSYTRWCVNLNHVELITTKVF